MFNRSLALLKDYASIIGFIPVLVTVCCYIYGWSYLLVVLRDDIYLASITDFITHGAVWAPLVVVLSFMGIMSHVSGIEQLPFRVRRHPKWDSVFGTKKSSRQRSTTKFTRNFIITMISTVILIFVVLTVLLYFDVPSALFPIIAIVMVSVFGVLGISLAPDEAFQTGQTPEQIVTLLERRVSLILWSCAILLLFFITNLFGTINAERTLYAGTTRNSTFYVPAGSANAETILSARIIGRLGERLILLSQDGFIIVRAPEQKELFVLRQRRARPSQDLRSHFPWRLLWSKDDYP